MIYATRDGASTLIVAAADSLMELESLYERVVGASERSFAVEYRPSVADMLLDERFQRYKNPPYVFEFETTSQLQLFTETLTITCVPSVVLVDQHHRMIEKLVSDPYLSADADQRSLAEVLGLDVSDPWDQRTDEQRAQDEAHRKDYEDAKKAGKVSGDSFAPNQSKAQGSNVVVTDVRTTRNADGSITIDDVLAVKTDLYDDNGPRDPATPIPIPDAAPNERFFGVRLAANTKHRVAVLNQWLWLLGLLPAQASADERTRLVAFEDADGFVLRGEAVMQRVFGLLQAEGIQFDVDEVDARLAPIRTFTYDAAVAHHINPGGWIAIYHRVDVPGHGLAAVVARLVIAGEAQNTDLLSRVVAARGQTNEGCWLACATKAGADSVAAILAADPLFAECAIEVYGVNDRGERLTPKGIEIIEDGPTVEPPRPWNDRAELWAAMDAEARQRDDVRLAGREFIFSGSYRGAGDGCVCYITPRSYFMQHGMMWDEPLDIVLPVDLKQVRAGIFQTKSRDWTSLSQDLSARGLIESMALQLYINALD